MVKCNLDSIEVSTWERTLINACAAQDALYYRLRASVHPRRYGGCSFAEIFDDVCDRRVKRYQKLLAIKRSNHGEIPDRIVRCCFSSPCDYTRLILASLRN